MGSRVMHAIIGFKIAEILGMEDKTAFLFGNIAPDAVFQDDKKDLSHFYVGDYHDYTRRIDFECFLQKYHSHEKHDYIWGYFTHLIADDLWLRGFYLTWLKNRMEADEGLYKLYHNDFRLLNAKLLEYYDISDGLRESLNNPPIIIDLEEVKSADVEKFVPYLISDLEYDKDIVDAKLHVFTFDQIVGYIETSIEKGRVLIQRI